MDSDDLFDRLVRKQAGREISASSEELTDDLKSRLTQLFSDAKQRGSKATKEDLAGWQAAGIELPISLVIFGAFLQGIPMPVADDPEIKTEALGDLGACFYAGPKLFAFHDEMDGLVYMPPPLIAPGWSDRIEACPRFNTFLGTVMTIALNWAGCSPGISDDDEKTLEFDGQWAGEEPKTILDYFVRMIFENRTIVVGTHRLEQIEFEIQMRQAFGA